MGALSLKEQRLFSLLVTHFQCTSKLGNCADFTNWDVSVSFFLKGFLSVPFLPATELSLHQLFSFYSVVVLFSFALPLSVTPQCLVQSSVSSEEQVCSAEDWNASFANCGAPTVLTFAFWEPSPNNIFYFEDRARAACFVASIFSQSSRLRDKCRSAGSMSCVLICYAVLGGWNKARKWKHLLWEWHSQHMFPSAFQLFGNSDLTNRLVISYREASLRLEMNHRRIHCETLDGASFANLETDQKRKL